MPVFKLTIRKATQLFGGRKWSNTYHAVHETVTQAINQAILIWQGGERNFHTTQVYAYEVYVNNTEDPPFTPGTTAPVPSDVAFGLLDPNPGSSPLPMFNVVRVDYLVAASRPSRKFYRPLLAEGWIDGEQITGALVTGLATGVGVIQNIGLVDVDGQVWTENGGIVKGVTARRLGRDSFINVPSPPVVGP